MAAWIWVVVVAAILIAGGMIAAAAMRKRRTEGLQQRFGADHERDDSVPADNSQYSTTTMNAARNNRFPERSEHRTGT